MVLPSMPIASMSTLAVALLGEYVNTMTELSTRSVRRFLSDDIERRARSVNRVSNWATARSRRTKLVRMSLVMRSASYGYIYLRDARLVAIMKFGHMRPWCDEHVHEAQGHSKVTMLRYMGTDLPATVFCSTFSGLGSSAAVTTPSIVSAMVVAGVGSVGREE